MYYGKGFNFTEVYTLPIYLRRFYLKRLNKQIGDETDAAKKAQGKPKTTSAPPFRK